MMRRSTSSSISLTNIFALLVLIAFVALGATACESTIEGAGDATIDVTPDPVVFASVSLGNSAAQTVRVENMGSGDLNLSGIGLHNEVGDALSAYGDWPEELTLAENEFHDFEIEYIPEQEVNHQGYIELTHNDSSEDNPKRVPIQTAGFEPEIWVDPGHVDFGQRPAGSDDALIAEVYNIGAGTLELSDIFLSSDTESFSISFPDGRNADGGFGPVAEDSQDPPTKIEAGADPEYIRIVFSPEDEEPKHGAIHIESSNTEGKVVPLLGNSGDACLEVSHNNGVDFGPASINAPNRQTLTLRNCSPEADLELYNLEISDDDGGVFSIQDGTFPGELPDETFVLAPNQIETTVVEFAPTEELSHSGELLIESNNSINPNMRIPLNGQGVDADCPIAEAGGSIGGSPAQETVFAANQDIVSLSSDGSYDPDGTDLSYEWSVIARPNGSLADVSPSATIADPDFEVDIVGQFLIELTVYDEFGLSNCEPAIVTIDATPTGDIHVQLVWDSPQVDANYGGPSNGFGTDLDLHYVHPDGYWGHHNLSVYWREMENDWQDHGEVVLDIDDVWGMDPENLNHTSPLVGAGYHVGVHYYNDKDFGPADATVRIYFGDTLHAEMQERLHQSDNFWYVGAIIWQDSDPYLNVFDSFQQTHCLPSAIGPGNCSGL